MTALNRPPPGGILLLLLPLLALAGHYGYEVFLADSCLDRGGSFDYETWTCSLSQSFEATPYLQRHGGKAALAGALSLSGLIVLGLDLLKRRRHRR
ncbi:hypothetical protein F2Q65_13925 [Thiohalocapsa marina]|uniref:Uncharacterized protein n=1 Tax=Thiohalocapsa marina TaxID=424902 RepID=A0A5M8FJZ0_9GAMM|nr:hypothetical protein [Thiohalocapsa marina]KAA6184046.1 hypothetical protein F2Q65_13925 [Thiohalocapsa marina]